MAVLFLLPGSSLTAKSIPASPPSSILPCSQPFQILDQQDQPQAPKASTELPPNASTSGDGKTRNKPDALTGKPSQLDRETQEAPSEEINWETKPLESPERKGQPDNQRHAEANLDAGHFDSIPPNSEDKGWKVKLGGHIQMDYITWGNRDPAILGAQNYFNFRRLRLVADGTGYDNFDFRLQMTLEPGEGIDANPTASPDVKDAYVSMNDIPGLGRLRIGNFFVPFSLEQVTNDTNNIFLERSIPSQGIFAVDREVGIALYNCTEDQNLTWTGGLFFDNLSDTVKTRFDNNQGYRLSGRATWLPYYDECSEGRFLIHTGAGILHTHDQDDQVRFAARPQVQRGTFLIDSQILSANSYTTGNLELAIVWGRITLQNEAFLSNVNLLTGDQARVGGAYSHLSWFLTGESRVFERFGQHGAQFGRNRPFTNFFAKPGSYGWGAWEAKARWSYLDLTQLGTGQYNDISAGFNWYWSDRTRIMFDWIHPFTDSRTVFGVTESDLFAMRFDVNW